MSASTTPTSVTLGKSSPLAIIWVPSSRSTSRRSTAPRIRWWAQRVLVVSRSMRASRAVGNRSASQRSSCWVPMPRICCTGVPALGALAGERRLVGAVVAAERRRRLVHREADAAVGTLRHVAALRALEERGEPAPVEEQHPLLPAAEHAAHRRVERLRPGDRARAAHLRRGAQVHEGHRRQAAARPRAPAGGSPGAARPPAPSSRARAWRSPARVAPPRAGARTDATSRA